MLLAPVTSNCIFTAHLLTLSMTSDEAALCLTSRELKITASARFLDEGIAFI